MEKPDGPKDPELLKCWNVQQDHRASRGALRKMVSRYNIILIRKKNRIHISNTRANNCRLILLYGSNYFQTLGVKSPISDQDFREIIFTKFFVKLISRKKNELILFPGQTLWIGWKWCYVVGVMH